MRVRPYAFTLFLSVGALAWGQDILASSSGGFSLSWKTTDIRVTPAGSSAPAISFHRFAQAEWDNLARDAAGQSLSGDTTYRVLSFAGPYLSVEVGQFCECGGAHPTAHRQFQAIDLRGTRPEAAKLLVLTELFPEGAILAALKADKVVAAALKEADAPPPQNLSAMVDALKYQLVQVGDCGYSFSENLLSEFALYDVRADKVAVRISLSHAGEVCRGQMTQVGIELPTPEALKPLLLEAKAKSSGFLMIDLPKLVKGKQTSFHFSTKGK
jgi:hypothetical protein